LHPDEVSGEEFTAIQVKHFKASLQVAHSLLHCKQDPDVIKAEIL
jgi:hypothetical protein